MQVFTQEAVKRMVDKGTFKMMSLSQFLGSGLDEAFLFRYPSKSVENQVNGDGDWLEIEDYAHDFSCLWTEKGCVELPDRGKTLVYAR